MELDQHGAPRDAGLGLDQQGALQAAGGSQEARGPPRRC